MLRLGRGYVLFKGGMTVHIDIRPVVETGTTHALLGDLKSERTDKVQRRLSSGARARYRSSVLRYLRVNEHDMHMVAVIKIIPC